MPGGELPLQGVDLPAAAAAAAAASPFRLEPDRAHHACGVLTSLLPLLLLLLLLPHPSGWSQTVPTMSAGELPLHKLC
jgi:hypothetical protein